MLEMDLSWLEGTPFTSYLIPGIVHFSFVGLFLLLTSIGFILKPDWRWANLLNRPILCIPGSM
jgi:hypothetical protein